MYVVPIRLEHPEEPVVLRTTQTEAAQAGSSV
jgi:hypothetical protein